MDLREMQHQHELWREHNFPDQEPHQGLLGMIEEVGELAHAHLKGEQGIRGMTLERASELKADAIGDLFIYMLSYCNTNGLSIEACIRDAWAEVKNRDWVAHPETGKA